MLLSLTFTAYEATMAYWNVADHHCKGGSCPVSAAPQGILATDPTCLVYGTGLLCATDGVPSWMILGRFADGRTCTEAPDEYDRATLGFVEVRCDPDIRSPPARHGHPFEGPDYR